MASVSRVLAALSAIVVVSLPRPLGAQAVGAIRGRVVDSASSQGLTNVSVTVEGTPLGAVTRTDGSFDIARVPAGSRTVRARRVGFRANEAQVDVSSGGTAIVELKLVPQPAVLTEMVVTGYGSQRREAITGSVSTVDSKDANVGVVMNPTQMLEGRAPGVEIVQSSGEPGGNVQIRIRGGTSITASNDPLYVVDGVPIQNDATVPDGAAVGNINSGLSRNPLNSINPSDIETITILKDASATAIYGSRAANGVILITTKRAAHGVAGQAEYETYVGSAVPAKRLGLASASQYRAFVTQFKDSLGGQAAVDQLGNADTDWETEVIRSALSMNHNIAFNGGSAASAYRASLNYFDLQGAIPNSGIKRYQGRVNGTHEAFDGRLRFALNLTAARVDNVYGPNENGGGFVGGLFTNMIIYNPTYPVTCAANVKPCTSASGAYYESGPTGVYNPVAMVNQLEDKAPETRLLGNLTGTVSLRENLTAQTTIGVDNTDAVRREYLPNASPAGAQYDGFARQVDRSLGSLNFQQLATYSPHLGMNHEVEAVGGFEYVTNDNREFGSASQGFISDAFGPDNMVAGTQVPSGYPYSWRTDDILSSFFGRVNYGYARRYFVTGALRRDGSSRLAPGHQWADFPGLSASWRVSEERFMRHEPLGLSSLALRVGWGRQGNQAVAPYQTQLLLTSDPNSLYPFGGTIATGIAAAQVGNADLKWETAAQTNVGVDFGLKQDRITGSVDIYQKDTKDLLLSVNVPQPAVVSQQLKNIGTIRNRGLEGTLDIKLFESGRRSLTGGLTLTVERNEVTNLGDSTAACAGNTVTQSFKAYSSAGCVYYWAGTVSGQGQSNQNAEIIMRGHALGTFLAPKFIEVKNGVQMFACTSVDPNCVNGESPSPVDADRQFVGNPTPNFTLGLHDNLAWNDFDASWLWRGEFGGFVLNNTALVYETKSAAAQGRNFLAKAMTDPDNIHEAAKYSTRWIEDRTFVRLQNLTIGYTLPKGFAAGRAVRVYFSGDNLLLATHYSGYDPEVYTGYWSAARGIDYLAYPPTRKFTIGARTQF